MGQTGTCGMNLPRIEEIPEEQESFKVTTDESSNDEVDEMVLNFMEDYGVPGLSLTWGNLNKPKELSRQYGFAQSSEDPVKDKTLFRIASISKPITSVTVLHFMERGLLTLDDQVFGSNGWLSEYTNFHSSAVNKIEDITIEMLL